MRPEGTDQAVASEMAVGEKEFGYLAADVRLLGAACAQPFQTFLRRRGILRSCPF